jgi:Ca2+-transporting ATPase
MIDPPRPEAAGAVEEFKLASVITVMITGDHRDTAFAIAKDIGIADSPDQCISGDELQKMTQEDLNEAVMDLRVFARVSPEHKVMIVKAFKSHGHIVSMTGDGVNDAPSLKAADIGVAMGITGTDVSKGAADMILTDDNFATIRLAIREGRNIFNNIRESVLFLLSSNLGEIFTMFVAIVMGLLSPLKAIHILWINLITDSLPALALGVDPPEDDIMKYPPRDSKAGLFANGGMTVTVLFGLVIGIITLGSFLYVPFQILHSEGTAISISAIDGVLRDPLIYAKAQTFAFTVLGISQLFNAIGFKKLHKSIFKVNHLQNKVMIAAFVVGFGLQIAVTEVPFLSELFETAQLSLKEWLCLTAVCTTPLWVHEIYRLLFRKGKRS